MASCSRQCWPSFRGLWSLESQPLPLRIPSRQFALHKLAFSLHILPLTDCPCSARWGFLRSKLKRTTCHTPLLDASRITGNRSQVTRGDAGSQSFASTQLVRLEWLSIVHRQISALSLGYKGGAEPRAWFGMENKASLQLTTSLFKMLPDWSGM